LNSEFDIIKDSLEKINTYFVAHSQVVTAKSSTHNIQKEIASFLKSEMETLNHLKLENQAEQPLLST
jgi:hypothetical protein